MAKVQLPPDTTLYPVPVVLITCGRGPRVNVFTVNRIASCNAEPPMVSISVRPGRASHRLIAETGEFVVNLPWANMALLADFVGSTTHDRTDKWAETGLTQAQGTRVAAPLLNECPVNLECRVVEQLRLPSHSLFIGEVLAVHAEPALLNLNGEVDLGLAREGLAYRAAVVRERPVENFQPAALLRRVRAWRDDRDRTASSDEAGG